MDNVVQFLEGDRLAKLLGFKLVEVAPGYALAKMEIKDVHLNAHSIAHGGLTYAFADYACSAAANSHGYVSLGVSSYIVYFMPPKGSELFAEAREVSNSNRRATYNVNVFDVKRNLVANFTGSIYVTNERIGTKTNISLKEP
ncbi:MAG: hotdog fold thioesterase [Syntrophomonadaceae bacterium]